MFLSAVRDSTPVSANVFLGELARAAAKGDEKEVQRLSGLHNVNEAGIRGSALHEAARRGHVDCVRILCSANADVNLREVTNDTPLHCAVNFGHVEVVKLLLSMNADVNLREIAGGTPLHGATTSLFIPSNEIRQELIELLMASGADPTIRDNFGIGPADNSHVQRVSKAMMDRAADHRRWLEMQAFLLESVPSHSEGPYAAANGPPIGPHGERLHLSAMPEEPPSRDAAADDKTQEGENGGEQPHVHSIVGWWRSGPAWWGGAGTSRKAEKEESTATSESNPANTEPHPQPSKHNTDQSGGNPPPAAPDRGPSPDAASSTKWNLSSLGHPHAVTSVFPSLALRWFPAAAKPDASQHDPVATWRVKVLPKWETARNDPEVRALWRQGIPPSVRAEVWTLAIGNAHGLGRAEYRGRLDMARGLGESGAEMTGPDTRRRRQRRLGERVQPQSPQREDGPPLVQSHGPGHVAVAPAGGPTLCRNLDTTGESAGEGADGEGEGEEAPWIDRATLKQIHLDLDRTFPELGFFNQNGPYHPLLRDLLLAYACHRPSVGYVQGMGYIAGTFLLYLEPAEAFTCMGNLLDKHHFPDFLMVNMERIGRYAAAFTDCLATHIPPLHKHLAAIGVDTRLYIVEWWMTLFGTILPVDAAGVAWDALVMEGVSALVRITLGILFVLQDQLIGASLESCLMVLTHVEEWFEHPDDHSHHRPPARRDGVHSSTEAGSGVREAAAGDKVKSFTAALEFANGVEVTSEQFMEMVERPVSGPKEDKSRLRSLLNQIALLTIQDEAAARERRNKLQSGLLHQAMDLWHSASAWTGGGGGAGEEGGEEAAGGKEEGGATKKGEEEGKKTRRGRGEKKRRAEEETRGNAEAMAADAAQWQQTEATNTQAFAQVSNMAEQLRHAAEAWQERARTSFNLSTATQSDAAAGDGSDQPIPAPPQSGTSVESEPGDRVPRASGREGRTLQPLVAAPAFTPRARKRGTDGKSGDDLWWGISPAQ